MAQPKSRRVTLRGPRGEQFQGMMEGERLWVIGERSKLLFGSASQGKVWLEGDGHFHGTLDENGQLRLRGPMGVYEGEVSD